MRVAVDAGRCIASGICTLTAPEMFKQDDQGISRPSATVVPESQQGPVEEAVLACPAAAISTEGKRDERR